MNKIDEIITGLDKFLEDFNKKYDNMSYLAGEIEELNERKKFIDNTLDEIKKEYNIEDSLENLPKYEAILPADIIEKLSETIKESKTIEDEIRDNIREMNSIEASVISSANSPENTSSLFFAKNLEEAIVENENFKKVVELLKERSPDILNESDFYGILENKFPELYTNLTEKSYERALELSEGFPEVKERIVKDHKFGDFIKGYKNYEPEGIDEATKNIASFARALIYLEDKGIDISPQFTKAKMELLTKESFSYIYNEGHVDIAKKNIDSFMNELSTYNETQTLKIIKNEITAYREEDLDKNIGMIIERSPVKNREKENNADMEISI